MSNYVKLATDAGDQYLASLAEMQETFLKNANAVATRLPPLPTVETPPAFAAVFPTVQEVTEASFAFAQKLLKQQKTFAEKLLAASVPAAK
jgi:aspartate/methionine/tyrosine aminotransferase